MLSVFELWYCVALTVMGFVTTVISGKCFSSDAAGGVRLLIG